MIKTEKQAAINQLKTELKEAKGIVFTENQGLTVAQMTELRRNMRKSKVRFKIVKNTLTQIAMKELGFKDHDQYIQGPVGLAYSSDDSVAPARLVYEFSKKVERLKIKGGFVDGALYDADQMKKVAQLPSKPELIAKLLYLLNWPLQGLVNVLTAPVRNLLYSLNAIKAQKEG